ncbi:MAG: DUF3737 family protein, partial [Bacteroidaceae bacterium]|nr:DUF3737 family protein [Bacteroidaceae bacterium]
KDQADYNPEPQYFISSSDNPQLIVETIDNRWHIEDGFHWLNGEYLAWYGKDIRLVRCHLTGEQLLCYVDGLILEDCTFGPDANLILEYSTVNGNIKGNVHSIKNPTSGTIVVEGEIGELIWDENQKAPADAKVIEKGL